MEKKTYRKKRYNLDTLEINAIETSKRGSLAHRVVEHPRKSRKRETLLSE